MITIISPATTMNFDKDSNLKDYSNPIFKEDINYLISILKRLDIKEISDLMNLSEDLSKLNYYRYQNLLNSNNKKLQSILAFDGEVFNSMNTSDFNEYDFRFSNDHLRILSGLYGILSPLDLIEAYRLEMKTKLENKNGNDLYKFWKSKITNQIIKELSSLNSNNLKKANMLRSKLNDSLKETTPNNNGLDLSVLLKLNNQETIKPTNNSKVHINNTASKSVSPEINLLGENVDTAIEILDKYLDNCSLAHLKQVRVIHGKGTGKLREGIHSYLKKCKYVTQYRIAGFGEGDYGVTIVELK